MIFGRLLTQVQKNLRGEINRLKFNVALTSFWLPKKLNDLTNKCKIEYLRTQIVN